MLSVVICIITHRYQYKQTYTTITPHSSMSKISENPKENDMSEEIDFLSGKVARFYLTELMLHDNIRIWYWLYTICIFYGNEIKLVEYRSPHLSIWRQKYTIKTVL